MASGVGCMVVNSGEICDPHYSWTLASMSRCMHISLLRLQDIWLTKLVTTGLVMPGLALARDKLPTDSGAIVGSFALQLAYSMMSSGHLPLMMPVLLLGLLVKGLVARVGWAENRFQAEHVENVAAPAVKMARLLSLMVQLASVAGDPFMLAIAIAYVLTLMAMPRSMRRKAGQESRVLGKTEKKEVGVFESVQAELVDILDSQTGSTAEPDENAAARRMRVFKLKTLQISTAGFISMLQPKICRRCDCA